MERTGEPPRETISLLITSILGGLAITNAVTQIQTTLSKVQPISASSWIYFLVFLSVWLRFVPGNISHIRKLERWPCSSVLTWLLDVSVIFLESLILVFMATPSVNYPDQFIWALLSLLSLDICWLVTMIYDAERRKRPKPQWIWLWLNIPSTGALLIILFLNNKYPDVLVSPPILAIMAIVFCGSAAIDIIKSASDWFGRPKGTEIPREEMRTYEAYMREAVEEAKRGLSSKGIPIGAILVENGNIIGRGYNKRIQDGNPIAHAEIECLKNAGRRRSYRGTTLFSTLMPCCLCAGAIIQFGIESVIVGESRNFSGAKSLLENCGVKVIDLDMKDCYEMLNKYIETNPSVWNEDIGKS